MKNCSAGKYLSVLGLRVLSHWGRLMGWNY